MATKEKTKRLTAKQQAFVFHYIDTANATEAAERAGYKGGRRSLAAQGSENLTKANIIAELDKYYSRYGMEAAEIIARLAKIARSFDPTDYIVERELFETDDDGERYCLGLVQTVDLKALRKDGYSILIKKIKQNSKGGMEIEYHDPMKALELLAKNKKLLTDRIDHTTDGQAIGIKGYTNVNPDGFPDKPTD